MKKIVLLLLILISSQYSFAQVKYILEDFEGFSDDGTDLKRNGIFCFGNLSAAIDKKNITHESYSGDRAIRIETVNNKKFGGWGKGIGMNIELDQSLDYLNFYVYAPGIKDTNTIRIELQEDDNGNNVFDKENDDSWYCYHKIQKANTWELVSIPLIKFKDANAGGDGIFNICYKQGKLFSFIMSFYNPVNSQNIIKKSWSFDFICFSKGKLLTGNGLFQAKKSVSDNCCNLGAWSKEGNEANFARIAESFESNFNGSSEKKLGVVHFFQPFASDGGTKTNNYPSVERINKIIQEGYVPMITLEDHFVKTSSFTKQPNLYSIIEGHFDSFFADWAKEIKKVKGTVLLRILHEFNGDWYPWCIVNNDRNPQLLVQSFRRIRNIFKEQQVTNVKFIWCPNSMSIPQEKWNFIMEAYPGDEYVDFVGLDIYNGAGKGFQAWRSFRKEGIENYFILTDRLSHKPLFVCETASRERKENETQGGQTKAEWIKQASDALSTDMSKVKLLAWFNEKGSFKINSSTGSQQAFLDYIIKNEHFKSGTKYLNQIITK